jgi:pyruvate,water dikinase
MLLAPLRDRGRGRLKDNPEALRRHCQRIDCEIVPKLGQDYSALSAREWHRQWCEVDEFGLDHFRVVRWGMGFYNPLIHPLLRRLLAAWATDTDGAIYHDIIAGLPPTRTSEINREIWQLGGLARQDPELVSALRGRVPFQDARDCSPGSTFWRRFDDFIARHGHRCASREVADPRWREQPEIVLGFVAAQVRLDSPPEDPHDSQQRGRARRGRAQARALAGAGKGVAGWVRARILLRLFGLTQEFTCYRENQRYHLDYLLLHVRLLLLEQGRRFTNRGVLDDPADVFYLEAVEFRSLLDGQIPDDRLHDRITQRHRDYLAHRHRRPATFLFDDIETEGEIAEGEPTDIQARDGWHGDGASRGQASGPARVITDIRELTSIQAGEILVTNTIDPGWTSVFPLLAGLITETGGTLSHGAILAREYGLPAITALNKATTRLSTGDLIEIDGNSGAVRRPTP